MPWLTSLESYATLLIQWQHACQDNNKIFLGQSCVLVRAQQFQRAAQGSALWPCCLLNFEVVWWTAAFSFLSSPVLFQGSWRYNCWLPL